MSLWQGWSRIAPGCFTTGRFPDGLEGFVTGFRGGWTWEVMRRLPPDFRAQRVADGHADVKTGAMIAAQNAIEEVRQPT